MRGKSHSHLNVEKILKEFQKSEESSAHRKDAFKIDMPFHDAIQLALDTKPEPKKPKNTR